MSVVIQVRRDTTENWAYHNPVLREGELGYDLSTNKLKSGDGKTKWNSLSYITDTSDQGGNLTLTGNVSIGGYLTAMGKLKASRAEVGTVEVNGIELGYYNDFETKLSLGKVS